MNLRNEQAWTLRPQSSASPSPAPSRPLCSLGPNAVSLCLSCESARSPTLPWDVVSINDISPGGSALEKMLTHMNRSVCIKETTYPQSKCSSDPTGDSIRQEASGWMLEAQAVQKILTIFSRFWFPLRSEFGCFPDPASYL